MNNLNVLKVRYLQSIGGGNLSETVYRIVGRIISHELGSTYSYFGKKGKAKFKDLHIAKAIIGN